MDCLFCKIVSGVAPSTTIFEDEQVKVFDNIHPAAPIHLLIIPKIHIPSIAHLEENHAGIISHMIFTAKRVAEERGLKGFKLVFNVGREGGQVIDHLHLHLLGGWRDSDEKKVSV
ncbi:MAG: HIT domain-containing protein [bacterium]|nr:HIT domain-containing protein [bacterium]MDZ4285686.1 HIT domain-containing protein [Candidatus Sungbacteria bacterium]